MPSPSVVAILVADIHLSDKPPLVRSNEPDWFAAMERSLKQLHKAKVRYDAPILCAGDVFDRWNASAALINFAMDALPNMWAVPGQHDLPYHGYDRIERTAFWTLAKAGHIAILPPGRSFRVMKNLCVTGVPWDHAIPPAPEGTGLKVAVVHAYCWMKKHTYPGAPDTAHVRSHAKQLQGYDVGVFGDNHIPFTISKNGLTIHNCGSFFRRTIADEHYVPSVGLLMSDGTVKREDLSTAGEQFLVPDKTTKHEVLSSHVAQFLEELQSLEVDELDFLQSIRQISASEPRKSMKSLLSEIVDAVSD